MLSPPHTRGNAWLRKPGASRLSLPFRTRNNATTLPSLPKRAFNQGYAVTSIMALLSSFQANAQGAREPRL